MNEKEISDIIAMAWCDKTSFETIHKTTGLSQNKVIALMRKSLKPSSFCLWRKRVSGRFAKHSKKYEHYE
ncbi:MAG: TIGR03643 family protein [Proteobacteria bacterium]|nr:TIGR03643 family protein [Pseudomonadota bacterium]